MTEDSSPDGGDAPGAPEDGTPAREEAAAPEEVDRVAAELAREGRPYARVTVVRREPPVSANVGDRAVVTAEGEVIGWVGGADCAQSVVRTEAVAAIEDGEPALVGLAPDPDDVDRPGVEPYPMTCHSGGTLEVFVEPVTPVPRLVVVGESPVARALARLGSELTYEVTVVTETGADPSAFPGASRTVTATDAGAVAAAIDGAAAVVVASMGEFDELGLVAGLRAGAPYVGLIASDERHAELAASAAEGLDHDGETVADAVTTPAGLDIGAQTAEEIAVSVLAELVAVRRGVEGPIELDAADATLAARGEDARAAGQAPRQSNGHRRRDSARSDAETGDDGAVDAREGTEDEGKNTHEGNNGDETVVDPVCGMDVVVDEAAASVEFGGEAYHFCGEGCADAFAADPGEYLDDADGGESDGETGDGDGREAGGSEVTARD